jgi:hypothetical protein
MPIFHIDFQKSCWLISLNSSSIFCRSLQTILGRKFIIPVEESLWVGKDMATSSWSEQYETQT